MPQKKLSLSLLICFFVAVFSSLCLISSGYLDSEDGWLYASVARNIYYHHQIAAAPDEYPDLNVHMNMEKGADGVWRAPGSLGYSFSLVPAVAISDLINRAYGVTPPQHFPLEHDWSFHLFASFTNAFYGALLATVLLLYANELGFSKKKSFLISVLTLSTTSLLPLTKFSFAHMMFISCMVSAFYFIKRFGSTQKFKYLVFSAIAFGLVAISYNETFTLTIIPLGMYLLCYETPKQRRITLFLSFLGFFGMVGVLFAMKSAFLKLIITTIKIHPKVLYEGVWGYLFSSGKSIFLYTPQLLIIIFFWHKIKKNFRPELIAACLLTFCYLYVLGSSSITKAGMLDPIWHGGMNWGTRYIAVLIPLWMLIVFHIVDSLTSLQKKFIVVPLFILGTWVQIVGVSTSYLLQYIDLPYNVFINKIEIQVYDYASFIPRFTPLLTLSKEFIKISLAVPETLNRGKYNVRFIDGFDPPYKPAKENFRGFRDQGYILFDKSTNNGPQKISLTLLNAPDDLSIQTTAHISIQINGKEVQELTAPSLQEEQIEIPLSNLALNQTNQLSFRAYYPQKLLSPQVIYIRKMKIDNTPINLASLDYPDMSNLGKATTPIPYVYTGKIIKDEWVYWQLRARVNERTLDFWWMKNFYFWDRPKMLIWGFVAGNVAIFFLSSIATYKLFTKKS